MEFPKDPKELQELLKPRFLALQALPEFLCVHCLKAKQKGMLGYCGFFVPSETTMTTKGEKLRCVVYPVCRQCIPDGKVTDQIAERIERNLIASGAYLGGDLPEGLEDIG